MRFFVVLLIAVSFAITPQLVSAKTATTIDELAELYNVEECTDCHEETHDEWKKSWHSQSLTDSRVIRTWRTFILSGLDKENLPRTVLKDACIKCHAPQIKDATDEVVEKIAELVVIAADDPDESKKAAAIKELGKVNINCLVCHNMKASTGRPTVKAIYGPGRAEETPHEDIGYKTIKSDFLKQSEFCAQCHHGCPPGLPRKQCYSLYTSYLDYYKGKGGKKTCQECHMDKNEDEIMSHRFPGIYEIDQLKKGIDFKLYADPSNYVYHLENRVVPSVVVNVQAKNMAGHGIPHG